MNKKTVYAGLAVCLALLLLVYAYFAYYRPAVQQLATANEQIAAEERLITALEARQAGARTETEIAATSSLQHKVPVKPMSDTLMLTFEKVELLSDSLITAIVFTEGEEEVLPETDETDSSGSPADVNTAADDFVQEQGAESENENVTDGPAGEQTAENQPIPPEALPAGIRKIRAQLTVESAGFAEMNAFIDSLENQLRTIRVEQLEFNAPEEAQKLEGVVEPVTYNLTVAAYYMPELTDLLEDTPEIDAPDPANKQDPFVSVEK